MRSDQLQWRPFLPFLNDLMRLTDHDERLALAHQAEFRFQVSVDIGLTHLELNKHDEWTRFLQIWFLPPAKGLAICYGSAKPSASERENRLLHLVSPLDVGKATPRHLCQDVNLHVTKLTYPYAEMVLELAEGRQAYGSCMEGSLVLAEMTKPAEGDSSVVAGQASLRITAPKGHGHLLGIEIPKLDERYHG